jgi:L-lactate dehydrogenase
MRIVEAILRDQATALSVSSLVTDYYGTSDICLSLPTVIDESGRLN